MSDSAAASKKHTAPSKRRRLDWEAIERDYRTGRHSLRELEAKHGAGYADIGRRAKREGWTKDLREVVQQATRAALIQEITTAAATVAQQSTTDVVLAAAELNKQVILQHRNELRAARTLAMDLLGEVQSQKMLAADKELLAQVLAGEADDIRQINEAQRVVTKALATGSRVSAIKALADTLTKLHLGERAAFSLDDAQLPADPPPALGSIAPGEALEAYRAWIGGGRG